MDRDGVSRIVRLGLLTVLERRRVHIGNILIERASEGHIDDLHAPADSKNRFVSVRWRHCGWRKDPCVQKKIPPDKGGIKGEGVL